MVDQDLSFGGFESPNWTAIPNEIFDYFMASLTGAEFKVLCYIARWTCGFRRPVTAISKHQMVNGYVTKAGKRIDNGAGVSERVLTASKKDSNGNVRANVLERLENMGLIVRDRTFGPGIKAKATKYSLNVAPESPLAELFGYPEPQDVAPEQVPPLTSTGEEQVPPLSPRTSSPPLYIKKERKKETTTDNSGSGPDSTDVEEPEYNPEDVYQPKRFNPPKKGMDLFFDEAGSLEVLNQSLRQVDQDIGQGKKIDNKVGYTIGVIRNKRKDADLMGPREVAGDRAGPEEIQEPELTEEQEATIKEVYEWTTGFITKNGVPASGLTDFARYYVEKYNKAPALSRVELEEQMKEEGYEVPKARRFAV